MLILPTAYFPNVQYCSLLKKNDKVSIDLGEHFIKQTIRSRTYILGANGILKLIVPLVKWRNNTPVKDICISYTQNWQKLHWKSIESAYRSSPYFEYYEDRFRKIILESSHKFLFDLNMQSTEEVLQMLELDCRIELSEDYLVSENAEDYRQVSHFLERTPKKHQPYVQVFGNDDFVPNLSYIDLICNEGPNAIHLL